MDFLPEIYGLTVHVIHCMESPPEICGPSAPYVCQYLIYKYVTNFIPDMRLISYQTLVILHHLDE